jgi:hypothetical protein
LRTMDQFDRSAHAMTKLEHKATSRENAQTATSPKRRGGNFAQGIQ